MGVAASEGVKPTCPAKPQRDAVMTVVMTSGMASDMAKVASTVVAVGTVPPGAKAVPGLLGRSRCADICAGGVRRGSLPGA